MHVLTTHLSIILHMYSHDITYCNALYMCHQPHPPNRATIFKSVLMYTHASAMGSHNINFMMNSKYKQIIQYFHWSLDEWDVSLAVTYSLKDKRPYYHRTQNYSTYCTIVSNSYFIQRQYNNMDTGG